METVERMTYEQYASAELLIAPQEVASDAHWREVRFAVDAQNPRVLLGRKPAGRAPGGQHTTDRLIMLGEDEQLPTTALALVRQSYDHRWLLHVVAGTHEPGSPHRLVVDVAGQQHLLGPDGVLLLKQDRWYRLRIAQDPTGPISRSSDAESIAVKYLICELWVKVKSPQPTGDDQHARDDSDVITTTWYVAAPDGLRVERKRAFILAHAYGPYLADLTDEPYTASTLAERIEGYYSQNGAYPADFERTHKTDSKTKQKTLRTVEETCRDEIRMAGARVRDWIEAEQRRTGEPHDVPEPSSRRYAAWLRRLGIVTIEETMSGQINAVVPIHHRTSDAPRFATYTLSRR